MCTTNCSELRACPLAELLHAPVLSEATTCNMHNNYLLYIVDDYIYTLLLYFILKCVSDCVHSLATEVMLLRASCMY